MCVFVTGIYLLSKSILYQLFSFRHQHTDGIVTQRVSETTPQGTKWGSSHAEDQPPAWGVALMLVSKRTYKDGGFHNKLQEQAEQAGDHGVCFKFCQDFLCEANCIFKHQCLYCVSQSHSMNHVPSRVVEMVRPDYQMVSLIVEEVRLSSMIVVCTKTKCLLMYVLVTLRSRAWLAALRGDSTATDGVESRPSVYLSVHVLPTVAGGIAFRPCTDVLRMGETCGWRLRMSKSNSTRSRRGGTDGKPCEKNLVEAVWRTAIRGTSRLFAVVVISKSIWYFDVCSSVRVIHGMLPCHLVSSVNTISSYNWHQTVGEGRSVMWPRPSVRIVWIQNGEPRCEN